MSTGGTPDIRFLLTYDFFGSFAYETTTWGILPGGDAIMAHTDALREQAAQSVWLDIGDFSGGGPLAPVSSAELSWAAAAHLGFDAAVPGNHEFDYGDVAAVAQAQRFPAPLIAADPDLLTMSQVFTSHHVFGGASGRTVAVVGVTFAERRGRDVYDRLGDVDAAARLINDHARQLRGRVDHVLAAVHEGVDSMTPGTPGGARMRRLCSAVRGNVDAVLGAHTIGERFIGSIAGVPYIQPWAMGAELGILDIDRDGTISLRGSMVPPLRDTGGHGWTGPGADTISDLRARTVGELQRPLTDPAVPGSDCMGTAIARGMLTVTRADVAVLSAVEVAAGQVPIDGIHNHLPAGPINEADVCRALPWASGTRGDELWMADLSAAEVQQLRRGLDFVIPAEQPAFCEYRHADRPHGQVVISSQYVRNAQRLLRRDTTWTPTGSGLRDALRAHLAGSGGQPMQGSSL